MEDNIQKNVAAEASPSEYWTAGGPLWINLANSQTLASKGMLDIASSPESLTWWFRLMGLSASGQVDFEDLGFASNLRATCSRVLEAAESTEGISHADLAFLNTVLREQRQWIELDQPSPGIIVATPRRQAQSIQQILAPVVDSLVQSLTDGDRSRLRTCAHPDCTLKFYDDSKNGTRRWCTMSACGNRAKAAAFLQRKKSRKQ